MLANMWDVKVKRKTEKGGNLESQAKNTLCA